MANNYSDDQFPADFLNGLNDDEKMNLAISLFNQEPTPALLPEDIFEYRFVKRGQRISIRQIARLKRIYHLEEKNKRDYSYLYSYFVNKINNLQRFPQPENYLVEEILVNEKNTNLLLNAVVEVPVWCIDRTKAIVIIGFKQLPIRENADGTSSYWSTLDSLTGRDLLKILTTKY